MSRCQSKAFVLIGFVGVSCAGSSSETPPDDRAESDLAERSATAKVVASGIPGAAGVAEVFPFHNGSPVHYNPDFAAYTQPGKVLQPGRVMVTSSSNFGAPLALPDQPEGSILTIDPAGPAPVVVPPSFATAGGQASALNGAVQVFTSQNNAFLNGRNNPQAVTANLPSVSLPIGISNNNAFGRPWFASVPNGATGDGLLCVVDPTGIGLAGAPDLVAGGVFYGNLTNRNEQTTHGLTAAVLATTLFTHSPDGSTRAVFLAAVNDGSIEQTHVQDGVDALVPAGSFTPLPVIDPASVESADPQVVTRVGIALNWAPTFIVYVTDPLANRIMAADITADVTQDPTKGPVLLKAGTPRYLTGPWFHTPVDVAPTIPESVSANFSSGTELGAGSDLYVLNRQDNTIVRVTQEGKFVAKRSVIPERRINGMRVTGLGVSKDGRTIYVTAVAPGRQGYLLKMAAFGEDAVTHSMVENAVKAGAKGLEAIGTDMFTRPLTVDQRLGPLFNAQACAVCHIAGSLGGESPRPTDHALVGRWVDGAFDDLLYGGGPITRSRSISEFGVPCSLPVGVPPEATTVGNRRGMTLRGNGLIDNIPDTTLLAVQAAEPEDVRGKINWNGAGRIGKFGWKAQTASLVEFMGGSFRTELGLTNPLQPHDFVQGCGADDLPREIDATPLVAVTAFISTIDPPPPSDACLASAGATVFANTGCSNCHTPSITSDGTEARLYSDLLLHDMGPGLADGVPQNQATGSEFRTMPLWRVSERTNLLHDGRASSIDTAVRSHGGQAAKAEAAYEALSASDRQALLDFLGCI
jgi:mono/diheme cytochrome c family protein